MWIKSDFETQTALDTKEQPNNISWKVIKFILLDFFYVEVLEVKQLKILATRVWS